ncbi:MAG: hypothetical protein ACOX7N_04110 [Lawsonibacter sp.]|jgi:hypothetical protein
MKEGVILLWTGCLLSIALSLAHFAWIASPQERLIALGVLALAAGNLRHK